MVTDKGDSLQKGPRGSWSQEPENTGRAHSKSALAAASGGVDVPISMEDTSRNGMSRSAMRASRPSVDECLGDLPKEEVIDLRLDVYNMFFLSENGSQGFFYSTLVLFTKMALYMLLFLHLYSTNISHGI